MSSATCAASVPRTVSPLGSLTVSFDRIRPAGDLLVGEAETG